MMKLFAYTRCGFKTEYPLLNGNDVEENNFFGLLDKLLLDLERIHMVYEFFSL